MAKSTIKLKVKTKKGKVNVRALLTHPMETGLRKNKKGKKIPAHYIEEVIIEANGKTVLTAKWGGSVSKNPYVSVNYAGAKGDTVKLSWKDNQGNSDSNEIKVKK